MSSYHGSARLHRDDPGARVAVPGRDVGGAAHGGGADPRTPGGGGGRARAGAAHGPRAVQRLRILIAMQLRPHSPTEGVHPAGAAARVAALHGRVVPTTAIVAETLV